jgi:hypothetical protein
MNQYFSTRCGMAASLLGLVAVMILCGAAVVAIAVVPEAVLPERQETAPAPVVAPDTGAGSLPEAPAAAQDGYPLLCVDDDGEPIAHWYFEDGTRDNLWYYVFG